MKTRKKSLRAQAEELLWKIYRKGKVQPHCRMFKKVVMRMWRERGLSQKELARRTGLQRQTFKYMKKTKNVQSMDTAVRTVLAMRVPPHVVMEQADTELRKLIIRLLRRGGKCTYLFR